MNRKKPYKKESNEYNNPRYPSLWDRLNKKRISVIFTVIKEKIRKTKLAIRIKIRKKLNQLAKIISACLTREAIRDLLEKLTILLIYNIAFYSIALNTHLVLFPKHSNWIPSSLPFINAIIRRPFLFNLIVNSPLLFFYYYIVGDIIFGPEFRFLGIDRQIKFAFLASNIIDFIYTMAIEYYEFFNFSSIITKATVVEVEQITTGRSVFFILLFFFTYNLFVKLQQTSLANRYLILSQHPLMYYPRKILYSIYFWIRIVPKKPNKK